MERGWFGFFVWKIRGRWFRIDRFVYRRVNDCGRAVGIVIPVVDGISFGGEAFRRFFIRCFYLPRGVFFDGFRRVMEQAVDIRVFGDRCLDTNEPCVRPIHG